MLADVFAALINIDWGSQHVLFFRDTFVPVYNFSGGHFEFATFSFSFSLFQHITLNSELIVNYYGKGFNLFI